MEGVINSYTLSLISYVSIFSIWDFKTNKHYTNKWDKLTFHDKCLLIFLILFHNVIFFAIYFTIFFIQFGILTNIIYIKLYLGLVAGVLFHWITNDNKCIFTQWHNRLIGISEDIGFRDCYTIIFNIQPDTYSNFGGDNGLGLRSKIYYSVIIFNIIYCIIHIFK